MDKTRNTLSKTRILCLPLFGIALISFTHFCECKVALLKATAQVVTVPPKKCSFNKIDYRVGENWNPFLLPKGYYRCIRCACKLTRDGSMAMVDCKGCKKTTTNGHHPEEGQKSCTHKSKTRKHNSTWAVAAQDFDSLLDNQCTECSCTDGFVTCATRTCPVLSCKRQQSGIQSCCPVCRGDLPRPHDQTGCETMGRCYRHLETWYPRMPPRNDMCVSCVCKNTSVECRSPICRKITCDNPVRKPGACCDSCQVRKPSRNAELLISKTRVGRKVSDKLECEWGTKKFPHNSTFHPIIGSFGIQKCVKCFCNATKLECESLQCPESYSCPNPVKVHGKCCKVCKDSKPGESAVTPAPGRRLCNSGKYWRVYKYTRTNGKQKHSKSNVWEQFALEDKERDFVEIHTIVANMTDKTVKVTNTTKKAFDGVQHDNYRYIYIGKIREVQKVKMKNNENRPCHHTQGCVHTVNKIMERLRGRVNRCDSSTAGPPDTLRMLKNQGSREVNPRDE